MTSIHGDAATTKSPVATTAVDAAEALCFARDLGGSLTDVVVAAAGRALAVEPLLEGATPVGLAVASGRRVEVVGVPGAPAAPLPRVRAEVSAALSGEGADDVEAERWFALVVVDTEALHPPTQELLRRSTFVLEAGPCEGDPLTLALTVHAHGEAVASEQAERLLARIVRLVQRPYRRLV